MQPGGYGGGPGGYGGPGGGGYGGQPPGQPPGGGYGQPPGGGYGQPPGGYGQPPGMPPQQQAMNPYGAAAPVNPYAGAQKALKGASGTISMLKYVFAGLGALMILGGIALTFLVGLGAGIGLGFTGVMMIVAAFVFLPQFTGMMGSATAQVNQLAAKAQLAQTGVPAAGRLLSVQQTGRMVNYNPEVLAVVEVQHPQMGTYQAQTTVVVPQIAIPQMQPGANVQVRINPQNPQDIAVVV